MEKELDLVEILKNCPQGTKLYSTIHGEVELEKIINDDTFPIKFSFTVKSKNSDLRYAASVSIDGKYNGECILFPSKDQRDWSKFKVEPEMVDGEFYYCCYSHNKKENSFIFIYEKHMLYKTKCYAALDILSSVLFKDDLIASNNSITELRKATIEEKQQLLDAIKIRNYEWNADKKELIKIEPKFDINTLQPFDKVLVRDCNSHKWNCNFFGRLNKTSQYLFVCIVDVFNQCVPYNDETKHLIGTTAKPPKKYINWEE